MKPIYKRAAIFAASATLVMFIIGQIITMSSGMDDLCNPGFGVTIIKGKVFDQNTNKLIDSVRLKIRYGASMDYIADTVMKQNDGITFQFSIPENDCEYYYFEVANKHYGEEIIFADSVNGYTVKKGATTEFVASLRPATTITLTLQRELQNDSPDTVSLYIAANNKAFEYWGDYSKADFMEKDTASYIGAYYAVEDANGKRRISFDFNLESNIEYRIQWVRKEAKYLDTLYTQFNAKPFDTISLNYEFKKVIR